MRKHLLTGVLSLLLWQGVQAQDIITKRSGENFQAKVTEITPAEVKFKKFENLEGPTYSLPKAEITLIQYENKTEETFELAEAAPVASAMAEEPKAVQPTGVSGYNKGQQDAGVYYHGYKGAGTGTLVVSLLSPLVGLVPAVACSVTSPKDNNLDFPSQELMQDPDYKTGYKAQSRKIKSGKVWKNWGIALGVNIALAFMLAQ